MLAPQSKRSEGSAAVGSKCARGVLLTPLALPTINCPPARIAPVLPAEIKASAFPSFRRLRPTTRDESFFSLTAFTGASLRLISSVALITSTLFLSYSKLSISDL